MFYSYVLKSKKDGNLYIGSTNDLKSRLKLHTSGKVFSTKSRLPLELVYYEAYKSKKDALMRENRLKQFKKGYSSLKGRIINSLML